MMTNRRRGKQGSRSVMPSGELPILVLPKLKKPHSSHMQQIFKRSEDVLDELIELQMNISAVYGGRPSIYRSPTPVREFSPKKLKPMTKKVFKYSQRVQFRRRQSMEDKPLILLNFEGVIGEVFKHNLWSVGPLKLFFRRGVFKGIKKLLKHFQVVLFIMSKQVDIRKLLELFAGKQVHFDAVYESVRPRRNRNISKLTEKTQDYSQVSIDFEINEEVLEKMLVVGSLDLSIEEVALSKSHDLLYRTEHSKPIFLAKGVPTHPKQILPISLLVPSPRVNEDQGVSFSAVANTVIALSGHPVQASWLDEYTQTKTKALGDLEAVETSLYQFCLFKDSLKVTPEHTRIDLKVKHCLCPYEWQDKCQFNLHASCLTSKHLLGHIATGKSVPQTYPKNKFIVLKSHKTYSTRFIQDHLFVEKPFYNMFKQL